MALAVPRPRARSLNPLLLAGLAAAVVVGGSYIAFFPNPLTNSQKTLTYPTSPVTTGTLQVTVAATGPVTNASSIPLTFKSTGKLAEVDVTVGQQVKAGDVLAKLDTSDLQTALATGPGDVGPGPGRIQQDRGWRDAAAGRAVAGAGRCRAGCVG